MGGEPTRKGYTGYEKDSESGLEFAQARYYNSSQGRFTSVDPLTASATIRDPQSFNRYSYALNSPYKFTDPLGLLSVNSCWRGCGGGGGMPGGAWGLALSDWIGSMQQQDRPHRFFNPGPPMPADGSGIAGSGIRREPGLGGGIGISPETDTSGDNYEIGYQTYKPDVYQGEQVDGLSAYGTIREATINVYKNGEKLTPETAKNVTVEETVTNVSTTIRDSKGNIVNAPKEIANQIRDVNTVGERPLFSSDGKPLGDRQGILVTSKDKFDKFKAMSLTSVDKITFTVRVNGRVMKTLTIESTKKLDSVTISRSK